jgi:beta-glucosidase
MGPGGVQTGLSPGGIFFRMATLRELDAKGRPDVGAGRRGGFLAGLLAVGAAAAIAAGAAPAADPERRIDALLSQMTLDEKVGQLNLVSHGPPLRWDDIREGKAGALINFNSAAEIARAQRLARESRLKIPPLFGLDVLHGFRTQFPVPLAEAAAFNPRLSRLAAEWAAREAAHIGVQWTYAPMADLSRDIRWGRIVEGFGEDPHLGQVLTAARVEGFHAGGLTTGVKHFAGYGAAEGGRDYDTTLIPTAEFRDTYLPPFRAALGAGTMTVMAGFNALNGVPNTANPWLLTEVLRGEWGFEGFVTSDWAGIHELLAHGVARDGAEAARKALLAGVDMDMMGQLYIRHLPDEVRAGRVPESAVDEAVRRVLRVKMRLGLFERPDIDPARVDAAFPTPEARRAAREVARETFVLLRNQGDVLPVTAATRAIAVVGPLADAPRDQLGPHAARGHAQDSVSIAEGLRRRAEAAGIGYRFAPGCDLFCTRTDGFAAAVAAARDADIVFAVVGEPQDHSGEAASRVDLALANRQPELLDALLATGKPVVLLLVAGRPLELGRFADRSAAIMTAWYPGTEAGTALAEVLFGDASPSGKLPVSYPRHTGQLPMAYNRLPTGRPTLPNNRFTLGYLDEQVSPLFPFGWGLSYTRFRLSEPMIARPRLGASDRLSIGVTVTNAGPRAGQEVVQLYTRDPVASRSRPLRELKAFEKIALEPGESRRLTLDVPVERLGFHLDDGTFVVEPGEIQVFLGTSSAADPVGSVEILEELRLRPGERRAAALRSPL